MKIDPASALALKAVIQADVEVVRRWTTALSALPEAAPPETGTITAAYYLHNTYNALENTFDQVSRTFENHVKDLSRWHRELLAKMFLDLSPLRPPVLSPDLKPLLDELRGFRHVFRHSYDYGLDPTKVADLRERWLANAGPVTESLRRFASELDAVAQAGLGGAGHEQLGDL